MACKERIEVAPFAAWLKKKEDQIGPQALADLLGVDPRIVYRYREGKHAGSVDGVKGDYPTDTFSRQHVEDLLDHASIRLWHVPGYEDLEPPEESIFDRFCAACHEMVTVGEDGVCPWCESATEDARRAQLHCERCNKLVYPTPTGDCWRCGTKASPIPWGPCACGCATMIRLVDRHGRPIQYVRGHAPRSLERKTEVAAEPFAQYLERQLRELDVLSALARMLGIPREDVVAVLQREVEVVPRETVRRAVFRAARSGTTGKGAPPRPDAEGFFDLYPDDKRARTCPECGKGKAPHAELCKPCRRRKGSPQAPTARTRLSEEAIADAYRLYREERLSVVAAAERIMDRTPNRSAGAIAASLRREWGLRGWDLHDARSRAA